MTVEELEKLKKDHDYCIIPVENILGIEDIVKAYADELSNWEFFSDSQRCYLDDEGRIVVCLRDYEWFKTKEKITDPLTAVKALFEIDWIAEYAYDSKYYIKDSKYWKEA